MEQLNLDYSIKSAKKILIVSHINPDGDALGSMCAMNSLIFKNYKKKCHMLALSKASKTYDFLENYSDIKHISEYDKSVVYDMVILVDVASLDRIGDAKLFFDKAKVKVVIDHHKTNNYHGEFEYVDGNASSTGEVIYSLAVEQNWKMDEEIAKAIYTAILTDTGGFRFENTGSKALQFASELVKLGVKPIDIFKKCYESKSKELVLFQAACLGKAQFSHNDRIAYLVIYKKDLEKFISPEDYSEGIVEQLRAIDSIQVAFVLKEIDNKLFKISMRSKKLDVSSICGVFGGGGHKFAAGCTIKASAEDTINKLLAEIKF